VNFNPYFGLGWQMVISGIALMGGTALAGTAITFSSIPWESWTAIAYLVIFGSVISFIAYLYALQNLATEQASLYAYINPIVAVLLGWLLLDELLTVVIVLGMLITLSGVFLVNRSVTRQPKGKQ
jgi:drug/metabolite transporter (DMT)-like permease